MGAAVLLLVEFGLGVGVNLYVTVPTHKAFFSTVFGEGVLAAHGVVALVLLGAAISAVVRSIRVRRAVAWTSLGLLAIIMAAFSGVGFVNSGDASSSLSMALATAAALLSYLIAIFTLTSQ
jgi:hypothetical protein